MPALAMILTAAMVIPGDGPQKVTGDTSKPQRLDLRGAWKGTWLDATTPKGGIEFDAYLEERNGRFYFTLKGEVEQELGKPIDEGDGKMRFDELAGNHMLGLYRQNGDKVSLCIRQEKLGRPESFQPRGVWIILTLHRVKSGK